ncbi:MAG: AmmeMemoRadiSam system protein A [Vicinamibacterales bacterium]|jgi:AmmeMemoRadiSam system protein A|nr:AmmeMemoRadiSam system protein A [Vicinamibacterales bacterium]MDP7478979.1 AmmeMemoRadiSam system protein A [Vicinamibacterales bacterium]MDP7693064.1 AmmeMemoRadiSam system protein A [Vicinamibacterales bacterium]HJN45170.1 AmmeMemoRadiSam system protein A [Vicinamibacterales bacterium]|tara:strand:+ start:425 stop:958 length:534 start_codon:yes stop_codon:yes gene_type:complete
MLEPHERQALLQLARQAIAARLEGRPVDSPEASGGLAKRTGAFVTIRHHDRLRGCIGSVDRADTLVTVVARCAGDAATEDPRFPPLPLDDLPEVVLEISVLGPVEPVADPAAVEVGRHGLVVEHGAHRGLLLPQVPTEWGWDRETFLSQTCVKAGLSADAWQTGAKLFTFEAYVFGE